MAEDGLLLLTERYPDRASDFARGIDITWWHGDAEPQGSLLAPQNWTDLLKELGSRELQAVLDPAGSALGLGSYLLIARPERRARGLDMPAPQSLGSTPTEGTGLEGTRRGNLRSAAGRRPAHYRGMPPWTVAIIG